MIAVAGSLPIDISSDSDLTSIGGHAVLEPATQEEVDLSFALIEKAAAYPNRMLRGTRQPMVPSIKSSAPAEP